MKRYTLALITGACLVGVSAMAADDKDTTPGRDRNDTSTTIGKIKQGAKNIFTEMKFEDLPPAVQATVRQQSGGTKITDIDREDRTGKTVYEIEFADSGANPKMVFTADGTIVRDDTAPLGASGKASLEVKGSATTKSQLSALPEPVRKTVQAQIGNAEVAGVNKKDDNGRVIYEIEFKDSGKNPTMRVAADGTIVEPLQK